MKKVDNKKERINTSFHNKPIAKHSKDYLLNNLNWSCTKLNFPAVIVFIEIVVFIVG